MTTISQKYLMEAMDNYPFNLPQALEALNYALSYDSENSSALCLMGQFYSEQLMQYDVAKEYFAQALAVSTTNIKLYPLYIDVLLYNADLDEAGKLIEFAKTIKGIDIGLILLKEALMNEYLFKFKKALKCLKKAKLNTYNKDFDNFIETEKTRIEIKMSLKDKKIKKTN